MKTYLGIDPGAKGFITALSDEGREYFSIADNDVLAVSDFLGRYRGGEVACVMEEVHAIFGSSAKATFAFGEVFGLLKGLLIANEIPYTLIQPKIWQTEMWENCDKVYECNGERKKVNTKATSLNAAKRLYPREDLRRTAGCRNIDDNKVDSLLIATYAKRRNL